MEGFLGGGTEDFKKMGKFGRIWVFFFLKCRVSDG